MRETWTGIAWTGAEKFFVQGVCFLQSIVLARLLTPEDFGLTAMLGIFLLIGSLLSESGLGTAMVALEPNACSRGLARRVLRWNFGLSVALYALLAVAAPFIASWYGYAVLKPLLWVMAVSFVISSLSVVPLAHLTCARQFDRLAFINAGSMLLASAVAILQAWLGHGVWSIVGLGLVRSASRTLLAWWAVRHLMTDASADEDADRRFGKLLRYGWKQMTSGIVHAIYVESYNLVIGKLWSPAAVGLFSRGRRWAVLPGEVINESVNRVALPQMASGRLGGRSFVVINAVLLYPCLIVLWIWASEIIRFVLGAQWVDCVPYLRILIVGQVLMPIINIALTAIRASGHAECLLQADAVKKPLGFAALAIGVSFGITGLCWAVVAGDVIELAVDLFFVRRIRRGRQ